MRISTSTVCLRLILALIFAAVMLAGCQSAGPDVQYTESLHGDAAGLPDGAATHAAAGEAIVIPPKSRVAWTIKGNCLDPDRAAPRAGDSFKLMPIDELIDPRLKPVYQGYVSLAAQDQEAKRYQQQIVWAMRTVDKKNSYASSLGSRQKALLERSYPGGATLFQSVHESRAGKPHALDFVSGVLAAFGIPLDLAALLDPDTAPDVADAQLQELMSMNPPEPLKSAGFGASEITDGIHAEIKGTGTLQLSVVITNTTSSEYRFIPAAYAAEAQRKVQRVTMELPPQVNVTKL